MRYILLTYQNTEGRNGLSREESHDFMHAARRDRQRAVDERRDGSGGEGLAGVWQARSTHVRDGVVTVTDGSFLEAKEAPAGYCIVDVATPDGAGEFARWPDTQRWGMKIGALMHAGGEEG